MLLRLKMLDTPNQRSNHNKPIPVGGGMGFVPVMMLFLWLAEEGAISANFMIALAFITLVSFADDFRGLWIITRIAAQAAALFFIFKTTVPVSLFASLPVWVNMALAVLGVFWFMNLYNFMDGIDGLAVAEAMAISSGIALCAHYAGTLDLIYPAQVVFAATSAFIFFNWQRAVIFMGDAGSISLGLILGCMLLKLATSGHIVAALILPAYFVLDASYTMIAKIRDGKKPWQAHSRHAYQLAVRTKGFSHQKTVILISLLNASLILMAVLSVKYDSYKIVLLILSYACSALMMRYFMSGQKNTKAIEYST